MGPRPEAPGARRQFLPYITGSLSYQRAVIGGVITSTLLTLLVIPTVYEILHEWREAFLRLLTGGRARLAHGETAPPPSVAGREPA